MQKPADPRGVVITRRQSPAIVKREFEREAKRILDGWVYRRRLFGQNGMEGADFDEEPADWMRRCSYRLIKHLIRRGHAAILLDMLADIGQRHAGKTDIIDKPFKQALLVMFWWTPEHTVRPLLDRRRRSELSDAMEYAHLHNVHHRHLNGFIKMAGIKRIPAKLRNGSREPGFSPRPDLS